MLASLLILPNCAVTGSKFIERTYSEPDENGDQWVESETIVRNRTTSPPFGGQSVADHQMLAEIGENGEWHLEMGATADLEGGEIATMIQALAGLAAEITKLIATLETGGAATLFPLTEGVP